MLQGNAPLYLNAFLFSLLTPFRAAANALPTLFVSGPVIAVHRSLSLLLQAALVKLLRTAAVRFISDQPMQGREAMFLDLLHKYTLRYPASSVMK